MSRKRPTQDSLELFLDAVCNMFGGFIFLMLFVVVSMRSTSEATLKTAAEEEAASAAALETLEIELTELRERQALLADAFEDSRAFVAALAPTPVLETLRESFDALDDLNETSAQIAEKTRRVAQLERQALQIDAAIKKARFERDAAEKERRSAEADAEKIVEERSKNASTPQLRLRDPFKTDVAVMLKYGKLYFWHKDPNSRVLNVEDFIIVEEKSDAATTIPRVDRGLDLNAPDVEKRLNDAFAKLNPNDHRVTLVVAADSFAEYAIVRDYLKKRNFGLRPMIGTKGQKVYDRGGSDARTQ